jgi:hypothetical protein
VQPKAKRRLKLAVALLVGVPAAGIVTLLVFMFIQPRVASYQHQEPFDSTGWKSRSRDGDVMWPTRLRMIDDLMRRRLLDGQSRDRVEVLLGPPDPTDKFSNWDMVYHLGPERGLFRIDSEWLVLRLNSSGNVTETRLVWD